MRGLREITALIAGLVLVLATACSSDANGTSGGAAPTAVAPPPGRQLELAPIDGLDLLVRESFPPQYALAVLAGLPSGCAEPAGHEVERKGTSITVRVWNSLPTGQVACTMIYGSYDLTIELGVDFTSGTRYTVDVNDKQLSFTAQ